MRLFAVKKYIFGGLLFFGLLTTLSFQNCSKFEAINSASFGLQSSKQMSLSELSADQSFQDLDALAPDCAITALLRGYKCLDRIVATSEGKAYSVRIKWNRLNQSSRGSFIFVNGGTGKGEALEDKSFKYLVDKLDQEDHVRAIFIEFIDDARVSDWAGCWTHGGGYASTGLLFRDTVKLIVDDLKVPRGDFLNYLGLSNGTMLLSYGMSFFGMDKYFDRVVLQAGPVMASAKEACDQNNPKSISKANTKEKADFLLKLFSDWLNGRNGPDMCANINNDDRMSILGPQRSFPNTHVHTIIGALENKYGFGNYHVVSNEDWFNKISAKSKERLVPDYMGHTFSYKDIRRYLKLDKNEVPMADADCIDQATEVCNNGRIEQYSKRSCYQYLPPSVDPDIPWQKVNDDTFKLITSRTCPRSLPSSSFQFFGAFYGDGSVVTRREHRIVGAGPMAKVCLGRYSIKSDGCVNESEFVFLRDRVGVGGYYDAGSDTYVISENLYQYHFPFENYYTVFILSDGTRKRIEVVPILE